MCLASSTLVAPTLSSDAATGAGADSTTVLDAIWTSAFSATAEADFAGRDVALADMAFAFGTASFRRTSS